MDSLKTVLGTVENVVFEDADRLFYRKFPYRIEVFLDRLPYRRPKYLTPSPSDTPAKCRDLESRMWAHRRTKAFEKVKSSCDDLNLEGEWRCRRAKEKSSFFFTTQADALAFATANKKFIRVIAGPRGTPDAEVMQKDHKNRVRNSLYWLKYRWKVSFKWLDADRQHELDEWFAQYLDCEEDEVRDDRFRYAWTQPSVVYLAEETDVIMVKVAFNAEVTSIEKAILKQEIDNERSTTQETD